MAQQLIQHHTFTLEHRFPKAPAKVFAAFSDPQRKRRWFAESTNHEVERFEMQFEAGGREFAAYRFKQGGPFAGVSLEHQGTFLDIVPEQRIVTASTMLLGGGRISASLETFEFHADGDGTRLLFTHQAAFFEGSDGPQMRQQGWEQLFSQLQAALAAGN
jgi:uncharacterized protein YndB with AHSA1/START domain